MWHICKQWALRNLFKDFSLVIHTSLLDREHDVRNLADIIPHPSERLRRSEPWFHSWYRGRVETRDAKYNDSSLLTASVAT